MPRNGSGEYTLPYNWNDDKANGIKVLASRMQAQDQDIANALTGSLASNGETPLTGNLDFGGNKANNLDDGEDSQDAVTVVQSQTGILQYYGVSSTIPAGDEGVDYQLDATPTLAAYVTGMAFRFTAHVDNLDDPVARIGTLATLNLVKDDGAGGYINLVAGDLLQDRIYNVIYSEFIATDKFVVTNPESINTNFQVATTTVKGVSLLSSPIIISNNVSDANSDIDFSAGTFQFFNGSGQAAASALTKRLDATWVAGNNQGGLFSGSKANNTWYHCFAIVKDSDNSVDFGFDTSVTAANIPSGYTNYKRVGSIKTNSSGNILSFTQNDKTFLLNTILQDIAISAATSPSNHTITAPFGVSTLALVNFYAETAGVNNFYLITNPSSNTTVSTTNYNATISGNGVPTTCSTSSPLTVKTNTSSQVSINATSAAGTIEVNLLGWIDYQL